MGAFNQNFSTKLSVFFFFTHKPGHLGYHTRLNIQQTVVMRRKNDTNQQLTKKSNTQTILFIVISALLDINRSPIAIGSCVMIAVSANTINPTIVTIYLTLKLTFLMCNLRKLLQCLFWLCIDASQLRKTLQFCGY